MGLLQGSYAFHPSITHLGTVHFLRGRGETIIKRLSFFKFRCSLIKLSLALIFIFAVVELFFATCAAVGVSFRNALSQSVLYRVHEGINIVSDFSAEDWW